MITCAFQVLHLGKVHLKHESLLGLHGAPVDHDKAPARDSPFALHSQTAVCLSIFKLCGQQYRWLVYLEVLKVSKQFFLIEVFFQNLKLHLSLFIEGCN